MQAGILEDFEFSKWWKTFDFPIEMSKLTSNIFKNFRLRRPSVQSSPISVWDSLKFGSNFAYKKAPLCVPDLKQMGFLKWNTSVRLGQVRFVNYNQF